MNFFMIILIYFIYIAPFIRAMQLRVLHREGKRNILMHEKEHRPIKYTKLLKEKENTIKGAKYYNSKRSKIRDNRTTSSYDQLINIKS